MRCRYRLQEYLNIGPKFLYHCGQFYKLRRRLKKLSTSFEGGMSLFGHFNGHFPSGLGIAGTRMSPFWILSELMMMEVVSGDNWSYKACKAAVISLPPTSQHPDFYRPGGRFLSCRPTDSVGPLKGNGGRKISLAKIHPLFVLIWIKEIVRRTFTSVGYGVF